jgi:excisionase family DNA binding protein
MTTKSIIQHPPTTSNLNTLRTPEAAAYLNVQPATLEQWRWNGRGPRFCKIGRSVRYRQADLDLFLAERVFQSTTEAQAA